MLLLAFSLALLVTAAKVNTTIVSSQDSNYYGSLVDGVDKSLGVCTEIVKEASDFRDGFITKKDLRRLSDNDGFDDKALVRRVKKKLGTCIDIVDAVDSFRKDYLDILKSEEALAVGFKDHVVLNVGGQRFTTTRSTLTSIKGSFFEKMFREGSNTTISSDGSYLIDRDPSSFGHILDYLRNGDLLISSSDKILRLKLLNDADYFLLPEALKDYLRWSAGIDLWFSEVDFINNQLKRVSRGLGGILYQSFTDGHSVSTFHSRVDSKGPTVVIVETKSGNIFGGYSYSSWASSGGYRASSKAFLFRLRPTLKRFDQKSGKESYGIYNNAAYGPTFGGGHDIYIKDCRSVATCYVNGNTYTVPSYSSYELNDGERNFRMQNYVVVKAKSL